MSNLQSQVCVLGTGHLAAAVRARLALATPAGASDNAGDCFQNQPALFLACSDFENASLCASLGQLAQRDHASVLFACVSADVLRVGPLVSGRTCSEPYLTLSWDFSLNDLRGVFTPSRERLMPNADSRKAEVALFGASLVVGELAKVLFAAQGTRLVERVTEIDSPSCEAVSAVDVASGYASSLGIAAGETEDGALDETFVASRARSRSVWARLAHPWHPAGIG
jgi:hypothetical protein